MKFIGKILSVLTFICYLLILAILVVAAPMVMGYKPVVVLTGSMVPTYEVGSVIYYKAASFDSIQKGDAITFRVSDDAHSVVTHRVYEKNEAQKTFITKGDANVTPDASSIAYSNVVGKVMAYHLPLAGYFVQYVQNYFLIASVFLVFVAKLLFDYLRDSKKKTIDQSIPK